MQLDQSLLNYSQTITHVSFFLLQLQVSETYKEIFLQVQEQIASNDAPFYLFKNIVTNGARGIHLIHTSTSTFIDPLNDDYAIYNLVPIAE